MKIPKPANFSKSNYSHSQTLSTVKLLPILKILVLSGFFLGILQDQCLVWLNMKWCSDGVWFSKTVCTAPPLCLLSACRSDDLPKDLDTKLYRFYLTRTVVGK